MGVVVAALLFTAILLAPGDAVAADAASGVFTCNTTRVEIGGAIARWDAASQRLALLAATLAPGGRIRTASRGIEEFSFGNEPKTKATWDVRVDTTLHAR